MGGSIQRDLSYATILSPFGETLTIYREQYREQHVEDPRKPNNNFTYLEGDTGLYTSLASHEATWIDVDQL